MHSKDLGLKKAILLPACKSNIYNDYKSKALKRFVSALYNTERIREDKFIEYK